MCTNNRYSFIKILPLLLLAVFLFSCKKENISGSGINGTRSLALPPFTAVESHYGIKALVSYSTVQEVSVSGYENLLNILDVKAENGVLKLKYKDNYSRIRNENLVATIKIPVLDAAVIHGSGNIEISNFNQAGLFSARIHGSGNIIANSCNYQSAALAIHGSGDVRAGGMRAAEAFVSVYGSGHTYITVADKLVSKIYGSGNIYYRGNPLIELTQNGSGRVMRW